ncbi:MAG: hypothetical protein AAF234_07925 [Pseudomonadota bacterium]
MTVIAKLIATSFFVIAMASVGSMLTTNTAEAWPGKGNASSVSTMDLGSGR